MAATSLPAEVLDPFVTDESSQEPMVDDQPIPIESDDYQTSGFYQNWIAFENENMNIAMVNPVTGEIKQVTTHGSSVINTVVGGQTIQFSIPAWSSDGELLAFKQELMIQQTDRLDTVTNIWVYEPASQTSWMVLENVTLSGYAWRPGSHSISYIVHVEPGYFTARGVVDASLAHGIMQVDVKSGKISELVAPQGFSLVQPKWSPDGSLVSFDEVHLMEGRGNFAFSPRFSPIGAQLAYVVGNGSIDQVNGYQLVLQAIDSNKSQMLLEGEQIETFAWSGDGSFLAASLGFYGSADIVVIDMLNGTVTEVAQGWAPVWQK
ncbi:MAG: hypothetical protein CVU41_12395 [Chloroflexi bacterium HGW-Chloroflexi-3]|nr:MAG: hypothetical protein CVU41_12395 [Chloroflexi bacterium HGW-Chloroflexi-3]